jgi:hypothetical protein
MPYVPQFAMFENLDQNKGQNLTDKTPPPFQGGVKGGFASASPMPSAPKVEDMFAGIKDASAPAKNISSLRGTVSSLPGREGGSPKSSGNILRVMAIIIIVLVIVFLGLFLANRYLGKTSAAGGIGGWMGNLDLAGKFSSLKSLVIKEKQPGAAIIEYQKEEIPAPAVTPPAEEIPAAATSTENASGTATVSVDTDGDGLSDAEEAALGTNPLKADTDDDGLSDYDEVKKYGTNPNLADTDGDTYLDGAEVKSGYNPNGAGKLTGNATTTGQSVEETANITYLVSKEDKTKYCNGGVTDDSAAYRKTIIAEAVSDISKANLTQAELAKQTAILATAGSGMCQTAIKQLNFTVADGAVTIPPIDGWAGISIAMCSCVPQVEVNLLRIPGITKVIWQSMANPGQ